MGKVSVESVTGRAVEIALEFAGAIVKLLFATTSIDPWQQLQLLQQQHDTQARAKEEEEVWATKRQQEQGNQVHQEENSQLWQQCEV